MRPTSDDADRTLADEQVLLFLSRVQARTELSEAEADALARATLRRLAAYLSEAQAEALSGALPGDLAGEVTAAPDGGGTTGADDFLEEVTAHLHAPETGDVERQVRAVLSTLRAWAPDGQLENTLWQLPPDLAVLFA